MSFTPLNQELLDAAVGALPDNKLKGLREQALSRFVQLGLPTTRNEDWRYTNLAGIATTGNQWLSMSSASDDSDAAKSATSIAVRQGIDAHWIEFRAGRLTQESLPIIEQLRATGIHIERLVDSEQPTSLFTDDALSSLNAALTPDPLKIKVDRDAVFDKPVAFLLADEVSDGALASQARVLIDVADGASAEFLEVHVSSGGGEYFSNLVTELNVGSDAAVRYLKLQNSADQHAQVGRLQARLQNNSRLEHFNLDIGGSLVRNDCVLLLEGEGADACTTGLYLASGQQHIDNHICADHIVGPAASRQIYRGIANGRARCVFNGKAIVREGADGTDATQSNHNLLLSDKAEIDTKPELEIYADDVKCAHGATIGQLDERAIFYLRSRGLDRDQAAQILTRAFASRVVADLPVPAARDYVESLVDQKLDELVDEAKQQ